MNKILAIFIALAIFMFVVVMGLTIYAMPLLKSKKGNQIMGKKKLNETSKEYQELKKEWLEFTPQSEQELFDFIHKLTTKYQNDKGTAVTMCVAMMKAVLKYMCKREGFGDLQMRFMMLVALSEIFDMKDKIGLRVQRCEELAVPQLVERFSHIKLTQKQCDKLKEYAIELKKTYGNDPNQPVAESVMKHWEKIACGWLPSCVVKEVEEDEE